jgi:Tfp pilus assembly protein PilW
MAELLVATALGCMVLAAVLWASLYTTRSFVVLGNYRNLAAGSRNALDKMTQQIRQVDHLSSYSANSLVFQTTDPFSGTTNALTFTYDSSALTLTQTVGTTNTALLTNCSYFHFDLFQRNPVNGTNGGDLMPLISSNQASLVKAIDLTWICSETAYGKTYTSQDVQSARVVIRKD